MSPRYGTPEAENPEWTPEMFQHARRGSEVFSPAFLEAAATAKRRRGPQKAPTKQLVSLRVDPDVLAAYRATGKGWQVRINKTLAAHAPGRRRKAGKKTTAKTHARGRA